MEELYLKVQVSHCLHIGKDTGGDHQSQHVDRDQEHGAHSKGDQETLGEGQVDILEVPHLGYVLVYLDLHHGHHCEAGKEGRGSAGGLQLGPAQLGAASLISFCSCPFFSCSCPSC